MIPFPTGTVTFLFTDIEGSTKLWEEHPEAMKTALARHDTLLQQAIESHNGCVFKTVGDAFCAAFATAPDALHAALSAQRMILSENWGETPIRVRIALHTGMAEERDGDYFGPPLNRVARLLSAGYGGQTLLSLATQELVRDQLPLKATLMDLGQHRLKDLFRPEQVYQLAAPDLPTEFPPLKTLDTRQTNLPAQPTPLVGREREVAAILALLRREDVRLVTLTGPGGTGKTRLSLQAAADLLDEYEHGVWFVDLAPISDPDLVGSTIASVLGVRESGGTPLADTLKDYLREKQILLVLDNFEQIVRAAPVVSDLLAAAPRLKIVVTSREVLRLRGEHDYAIPPLGLPERGRKQTVAVLSQYEAVALFIQRAKAANQNFEITDGNAPAVAEICVRVDGLPLAIEIVAARARMLTPQQMLEKLSDRLKALTGGSRDLPARQQTIRSTIEWSYHLLDEDEKRLFARLGLFVGGCTLEAAEAVCGEGLSIEVFDGLESLADKSLLRQTYDFDNEPRFTMLETIREYARDCLNQQGDAVRFQYLRAKYFCELAETAMPFTRAGGQQMWWLRRLEREYDNLRAVLNRSLGGPDHEIGQRLVGALTYFFNRQGHHSEWEAWLVRAMEGIDAVPPPVQAALYTSAGVIGHTGRVDIPAAIKHFNESMSLFRKLHDPLALAWSLMSKSMLMAGQAENYNAIRPIVDESITIMRQLDDKAGLAQALNVLGNIEVINHDFDRAKQIFEECLDLALEIGDLLREAIMYGVLSRVAAKMHELASAENYARKSFDLAMKINFKMAIMGGPFNFARIAAWRSEYERAACLLGACVAIQEGLGIRLQPHDQNDFDEMLASLKSQLDEESFQQAWSRGLSMSLEESIVYCLERTQ